MQMNYLVAAFLVVCMSVCSLGTALAAKTWTVETRQGQLMKDINVAQTTNQLTPKEAKKLRAQLADVVRHKKKLKAEAVNGKLTKDDDLKLEADLNAVSYKIKELQLAKRTK